MCILSVQTFLPKSCWLLWFECSVHVSDGFPKQMFRWGVGGWGEVHPSFFWIFLNFAKPQRSSYTLNDKVPKKPVSNWLVQIGQAKGRLTLGAKFETLWNDFLSTWSWSQHSKVYWTTNFNQLSHLEKKLWVFETGGVGERERMHFLVDSIL